MINSRAKCMDLQSFPQPQWERKSKIRSIDQGPRNFRPSGTGGVHSGEALLLLLLFSASWRVEQRRTYVAKRIFHTTLTFSQGQRILTVEEPYIYMYIYIATAKFENGVSQQIQSHSKTQIQKKKSAPMVLLKARWW